MTEETKVETQPPTTPPEQSNTVAIDIDGVSIPNVPVALAKQIIEKRQATKKELGNLKEQVARAEASAKAEADKHLLLKAMKDSDIESVKSQVASEYIEKISKYENKIFKGEIKSLLATQGVLPSALDDAVNLALQGAKVTLEGDEIKINDKPAKELVEEFVKGRPHLLAVKALDKGLPSTKTATPKVSTNGEFSKFAQQLFKK